MTRARDIANLLGTNTNGIIDNAKITLDAAEVPNLAASKITSETFVDARLPNLATSKITSGTFADARIPNLNASKINAGTLADARIPNLNASKINAGTIATARLGSGTASSSTFLRGDGSFNAPPAGKVLQYVKSQSGSFDSSSGTWNVSSSTPTSTNATASITPTSSSSKIIGTGFVTYGCDVGSTTHLQFGFKIQRTSDNADKTAFTSGNSVAWDSEYNNSQQTRFDVYRMIPINLFDDNHGTTSEITYRLFVRSRGSAHQNRGGGLWMHLWEIEG
jgi:hypothetical protein